MEVGIRVNAASLLAMVVELVNRDPTRSAAMDDVREQRFSIYYPVYCVGVDDGDPRGLVMEAEGCEWLLLYSSRELAELYIEQAGGGLEPLQADSLQLLRAALIVNPRIDGFIWNVTIHSEWRKFIGRSELVQQRSQIVRPISRSLGAVIISTVAQLRRDHRALKT